MQATQEQESEVMSEEGESSPPVGDDAPTPMTPVEQQALNREVGPSYQNANRSNVQRELYNPNWSTNMSGFCLADIEARSDDIFYNSSRKTAKGKVDEAETPAPNITSTSQPSPVHTQ